MKCSLSRMHILSKQLPAENSPVTVPMPLWRTQIPAEDSISPSWSVLYPLPSLQSFPKSGWLPCHCSCSALSLPAVCPLCPSLGSVMRAMHALLSHHDIHHWCGVTHTSVSPSRQQTRLKWWIGFRLVNLHVTMVNTLSYTDRIV